MARLGRILSTALITAAIVLLLDVGVTLVHREPVSSIYGSIQQIAAESELSELEDGFPQPRDIAAAEQAATDRVGGRRPPRESRADPRLDRAIAAELAAEFDRNLDRGSPIGRIVAQGMNDLDTIVLEGVDQGTLRKGPGHYPATSLPGQPGTVAVAGHRTTYAAPFRAMDEIGRGDRIRMEMPYASFEYTVTGVEIVSPDRIDVIDGVGYQQLVLTACHPLYSAAQRIVAFARLSSLELGPAAGTSA